MLLIVKVLVTGDESSVEPKSSLVDELLAIGVEPSSTRIAGAVTVPCRESENVLWVVSLSVNESVPP